MAVPGIIFGIVIDKSTKKPIRGARIIVGGHRTRSKKGGLFMMPVPSGQRVVKVRRWRYKPVNKTVQVPPGGHHFEQFLLERINNY